MRRGEIWTAAGPTDYGSKPRPVVIIQDDLFGELQSVTVCPITSDPTPVSIRIEIERYEGTGLLVGSRLMIDKIATMPKGKIGRKLGELDLLTMTRMDLALMAFLGLGRQVGLQAR